MSLRDALRMKVTLINVSFRGNLRESGKIEKNYSPHVIVLFIYLIYVFLVLFVVESPRRKIGRCPRGYGSQKFHPVSRGPLREGPKRAPNNC
jgi:hypothetical protein